MKTSESLTEIVKAMHSAMIEIPNMEPNRVGQIGNRKYDYVDLAEIIKTLKPILYKHNLVCIQTVGESEKSVKITTRIQHVSGEFIEDSFDLPQGESIGANDVQKQGIAITYGKRYGLQALLFFTAEKDTDGVDKATDRSDKKPATQTKQAVKNDDVTPKQNPDTYYGDLILDLRKSSLADAEKAELEENLNKKPEQAKYAYAKFIRERIAK